jgi:hypothetical protein
VFATWFGTSLQPSDASSRMSTHPNSMGKAQGAKHKLPCWRCWCQPVQHSQPCVPTSDVALLGCLYRIEIMCGPSVCVAGYGQPGERLCHPHMHGHVQHDRCAGLLQLQSTPTGPFWACLDGLKGNSTDQHKMSLIIGREPVLSAELI